MKGFSNSLTTSTFLSSVCCERAFPSLHLIIQQFLTYFMCYNLLTIITYFDTQSTHQLVIGRPIKLATVSFCHAFSILWAFPYFWHSKISQTLSKHQPWNEQFCQVICLFLVGLEIKYGFWVLNINLAMGCHWFETL